MTIVINVENLSKSYHLGQIGTGTFTNDLKIWWARTRRKPNPLLKIGQIDRGRKSGEELWALRDVSFTVEQGEVLGIIGRNGAGKSTLLKILSRVTAPTSGVVKVKGRIASLLEVGTGFHPELTGRENIYLNGAILGMTRDEVRRKFAEIVDFAEIEKFIDTPVKRYSSGMYVRLAFAVAAHLDPEILIVDEVLAVGDAEFQKKCLGKMEKVSEEGRTVLFVSHNMGVVRKLCPNSILLRDGIILNSGETDKVINYYLNSDGDSSTAVIKLPKSEDNSNEKGYGLQLIIRDQSGKLRTQFKIGEKWVIQLNFKINRNLNHIIAGIGLANSESTPIITYWSQPADLKPGQYYVDFVCDLPLKATHLKMFVGLSQHERNFYFIQDIGSIEILRVSNADQPFRSEGSGLLLGNQDSIIYPLHD
ncbi:MAG TPA: polysaccharide ABC transporter ATP-binding protein [Anaerolineales bacterium]|nr:polysaccharide ABC transporter ATP-binding protein [Anaerolineales bacterium]